MAIVVGCNDLENNASLSIVFPKTSLDGDELAEVIRTVRSERLEGR